MKPARIVLPLILLLPLLCGFLGPSPRIQPPALVGVWVGKTDTRNVSKRMSHRTWQTIYYADGALQTTHRNYYKDESMEEFIVKGTWWVQEGVLHTSIETSEQNGETEIYIKQYAYRLEHVDSARVDYRHIESGYLYTSSAATESTKF